MRLIHTIDREYLPFPLEEYERRVNCLRSEMERAGIEGLVICGAPKRSGYVRYIANFESYIGTTFVIIPLSGSPVLVTDSQFRQEPMQAGMWMTWIEEVRHTRSTSLYLLDPKELELVYRLRRVLSDMNPVESIELLKSRLMKVSTNAEFLMTMNLS